MPILADVDIARYRKDIDQKRSESVVKRAAADTLVADVRSSGVDPLTNTEAFDKIDAAFREADDLVQEADTLEGRLNSAMERDRGPQSRSGAGAPGGAGRATGPGRQRDTIGRRFVESEGWKRAKEEGRSEPTGTVPFKLDGIPLLTREEFKENIRSRAGLDLASGQSLVTPEFSLIPPVELPVRQVRLIDLIDVQTTDTDVVFWGQQTERILAAAPTASGVNAPQETSAFQRVSSPVQRIPVLLTVPKEVLADEGRLQGILDKQMMEDTRLTVEYQTLAGDGTGVNFAGILNNSGIGSSAKLHGDYDLDCIHRGITYVRLHLFQDPDAIGLHPTDLEHIMLQKDLYGRYVFEPSAEQTSIWGFAAVSTPVFTAGVGLVGNYRMGATLWLREDVVMTATDGYTDTSSGVNYFSAGLVAMLAQIRAAFAVERPFAFCEVTGLGTTP